MTANTHIRSTLLIGVALVALIAASQPAEAIVPNFTGASGNVCLGEFNPGPQVVFPGIIVVYVPYVGGTLAFGYDAHGNCGSFEVDPE